MSGNEIFYWDACIFLAWLRDEERPTGEMEGVKHFVRRVEKKEIHILTSTITYTEVVNAKLPIGVDGQFFDFMHKSNISVVAANIRITKLARDLRDYYLSKKDQYDGKTLGTPDAIHLATAILYKAKEFHTFDKSNRRSLGLLGLNEDVGGHRLVICKPQNVQGELNL